MKTLNLSETIRYSVDELLKTKPEQLEGLKTVCNEEPDNYSININGIHVDAKYYKIVYGIGTDKIVYIHFYNSNNDRVACLTASGSNKYKKDEAFIVGYNSIMSETALRVMRCNFDKDFNNEV